MSTPGTPTRPTTMTMSTWENGMEIQTLNLDTKEEAMMPPKQMEFTAQEDTVAARARARAKAHSEVDAISAARNGIMQLIAR